MKSETFGEPIVVAKMSDETAKAMRQAVLDANPEILEAIAPVVETVAEVIAPIIEEAKIIGVPTEVPEPVIPITAPEPVIPEIEVVEEALIIKEEIIAPAAPKPEEKPDAPS